MTEADTTFIQAMMQLYGGLDRLGPGDDDFALGLLAELALPSPQPRIADLGCGTGAGSLLLARHFKLPVLAVEQMPGFLETLTDRAKAEGLSDLVRAIEADMGALDWPDGSLDLLWSEGAAYNLTFRGALEKWRRLLGGDGIAVISEMSWFTEARPARAVAFWDNEYPTMASEAENCETAVACGFTVLKTRRLPTAAWWENFYGPLEARMAELQPAEGVLAQVIEDTRLEIALFRECESVYGYTFYVLSAD
ncbi:MAG: class I SAM-dependent methyltransferase [Pseudomonadota bacterium]